jgi:prepilin-type N-terminal cleavage/methylation domain-containing protein
MKHLDQFGVTLIELVVATAVISVLTVLTMNFLSEQIVQNTVKNARAQLQLETQLTLDAINQDIKHSANIDAQNRWPDDYAPGAPADLFSWNSSSDTAILAKPATNSSNEILFEDPFTYITYKDNVVYYVDGESRLRKRILAAPVPGNSQATTCPDEASGCAVDPVLAQNVTLFLVEYFDDNDASVTPTNARSVKITLRLSTVKYNRTISGENTIRAVFRND